MNSLLDQSVSATGAQETSIYGQIQALQATDAPIIPLYQGGSNCCGAVTKTSVGGIYLDVTLIFRLSTIYETT
jgi:ABC-type transport system substrate-binding protein